MYICIYCLVTLLTFETSALGNVDIPVKDLPFDQSPLESKLPAFGSEVDYYGLTTYANIPYAKCLHASDSKKYDIAILEAPFDTVSEFHFWYNRGITSVFDNG